MWITIEQIACLKALADTGSLNAAADNLNKAKSAISYSINKLEEQIGFQLLDRSQYRVKLTLQGEAFLKKGSLLLKNLEQLKEEVHKIATGIEMKVCLSATAIYPTTILNSALKNIMEKFPSTELTFHREILSGERMLMNDTVDIAIFEELQNRIDIESKNIGSVNLKLVISSKHPFLKISKNQQSLDKLIQYPQIIQRSTITNDLNFGIPEGSKRWTVSDLDSKKELILNNLGWGRLPGHIIEKELKQQKLIHLKHLNYDHAVDIFLCKKKDKPFGPVLEYIWNFFKPN